MNLILAELNLDSLPATLSLSESPKPLCTARGIQTIVNPFFQATAKPRPPLQTPWVCFVSPSVLRLGRNRVFLPFVHLFESSVLSDEDEQVAVVRLSREACIIKPRLVAHAR